MALSPGHRFGQLIGDILEIAVEPILSDFAQKYGLYLDRKGSRQVRSGHKVSWIDLNANKHDLDFVLERNGSPDKIGAPVAFIEAAWRRYTKHSRNKAQEIQGAIVPLFETYRRHHPFKGAFLAGVFTEGALQQLRSLGFSIAYFPYETVIAAFATVDIDASFGETTSDDDFNEKFRRWEALSPTNRKKVAQELASLNASEINTFIEALRIVTMRTITAVRIFPLHGSAIELTNVQDAIGFIKAYNEETNSLPIVRYEVQVSYANGDKIGGEFTSKESAIDFLSLAYSAAPAETRSATE